MATKLSIVSDYSIEGVHCVCCGDPVGRMGNISKMGKVRFVCCDSRVCMRIFPLVVDNIKASRRGWRFILHRAGVSRRRFMKRAGIRRIRVAIRAALLASVCLFVVGCAGFWFYVGICGGMG